MYHRIVFLSSCQGLIHFTCQNVLHLWLLLASGYSISLCDSKMLCLWWSVGVWEQPVCFWQSFSHCWPTLPVADGCGLVMFGGKQLFLPSLLLCFTSVFTRLWLLSRAKCSRLMPCLSSQDQLSIFAACWRGTWRLNNYSLSRDSESKISWLW